MDSSSALRDASSAVIGNRATASSNLGDASSAVIGNRAKYTSAEPSSKPQNAKTQGKWIRRWVETLAHSIQQKETKEWLQMLVLDPFLSYIIDRIFPYFLLLIVLFALLLVFVIITCVFIIYRFQNISTAAATIARASVPI